MALPAFVAVTDPTYALKMHDHRRRRLQSESWLGTIRKRQWGQIFTCESRSCPPLSKNFHSYRRALKSKDSTPIILFYCDVPVIRWGDSTSLGVGDQVVVGGYPYGTELFRSTRTNRGVIQPTFYPGIISAIIPATGPTETRLLQISAAVAGGMSGGAVFDLTTGTLLGMVMSSLQSPSGALHPVTYAIPSEVIAPFASSLSFNASGRRVGKELPLKADGQPRQTPRRE